jgi:hypothetical protein
MIVTFGGVAANIVGRGKEFVVVNATEREWLRNGVTHHVAGFENGQCRLVTWHKGDSSMLQEVAAWQARGFQRSEQGERK